MTDTVKQRALTGLWPVSRITLSGAGLSSLWGETSEKDAYECYVRALDVGVNHIDNSPIYGRGAAEHLIGKFVGEKFPQGIRLTTKCRLGTLKPDEVLPKLRASLTRSLKTMKAEHADLFLLHSVVIEDDAPLLRGEEYRHRISTTEECYYEGVIPAMQTLVEEGLCGAWGITAFSEARVLRRILEQPVQRRPAVGQFVVNPMETISELALTSEDINFRDLRAMAKEKNMAIIGVRAVAAGALTDEIDREYSEPQKAIWHDYERAGHFRQLSKSMGVTAASLAYRYCFSQSEIETLVLGCKNRLEFDEALDALAAGPLNHSELALIQETFA